MPYVFVINCGCFFVLIIESTEGLTPTIGFVNSNLDIGSYDVTLYDLGGGARVRNIWKNYYSAVSEKYTAVVCMFDLNLCAGPWSNICGGFGFNRSLGRS